MLNYQIPKYSFQWEELFHTDRQRHMTKLTVAFRTFEKAPKNKKGNVHVLQH